MKRLFALRHLWTGLCTIAVAACAGTAAYHPTDAPAAVLVARRGWHIDVGVDVRELGESLAFIGAQFPMAGYVFFGFGDERYIRSVSHHMPALLEAAWPGRGVMLVTAISNTPQQAFGAGNVIRIPLTAGQRAALIASIRASFASSSDREAPLKMGPYADSFYFNAAEGYSGVHTCNTWAAEVLRAGGLPIHSGGVVFAGQLWTQVRPLDRVGAP